MGGRGEWLERRTRGGDFARKPTDSAVGMENGGDSGRREIRPMEMGGMDLQKTFTQGRSRKGG